MSLEISELQPLSLNQKAKKIYMLKAIGLYSNNLRPGIEVGPVTLIIKITLHKDW